jgi:uncharacterized protein YjiK
MTEFAAASSPRPARRQRLRDLAIALSLAIVALLVVAISSASAAVNEVNLATYKKVGQFELPSPTNTTPPTNSLLAQEASAVTYDWDTETLFVAGDGGTSIVQVSKTGALIDSMTLAPGNSPQGTTFYDTEGLTYIGNGEFVVTEERDRQIDKFKYEPGTELTRAAAKTVKLGTTIGNIGLEGVSNDPSTGGFILTKEQEPEGIFQTDVDWETGTATNGSATTEESTNLFPPADAGVLDMSDVYALANVNGISAAEKENLLIISQESGKIVNVSRSGHVNSSLALVSVPGNPLTIPEQTDEGVTMDQNGVLYVVNENGGGSQAHPQLWVFEAQTAADTAPTAVTLENEVTSMPEATTSARLKVASVSVADTDGFGENDLTVTGPDASHFEVESNGLFLKAGTVLNASTQAEYEVTVQVDDPAVGASPDASSAPYKLTVTANTGGTSAAQVAVTEVAPWGSGNSPIAADWFELTNVGATKVDLTGWRMTDNHATFASTVPLEGVSSLAPGHSAVFVNGDEAKAGEFKADWFPVTVPSGFQIGWLPEVGLSTSGDQVNIFDSTGAKVSGVAFGASPASAPFGTFDNTAALGVGATTDPTLTTLSAVGTNEAISADAGNEIGSPGTAPAPSPLAVTEVAPWGSTEGSSTYEADWFELTNESPVAASLAGWKIDDSSNAFGTAVALNGVSSIAPGESVIFIESATVAKAEAFETWWFGASIPAGFQIGTYTGSGVGLSSGGDAVNVFDSEGNRISGVSFGAASTASPLPSFENAAGLGNYKAPVAITNLSAEGVNGAFVAHDQLGSPGATAEPVGPPPLPEVKITEVDPTGSSSTAYAADWFELTNEGSGPVSLAGWKMDDDSDSFASGGFLTGVTSLPAGASAVFVETAAKISAFETAWFPLGVPSGFLIGAYEGPGLGSGGDEVNIFDATEEQVTGVAFGTSTAKVSFDNAAGIGGAGSPRPTISTLSVAGTNGAFANGAGEVGSPGTIVTAPAAALSATPPVFPNQAADTTGPGQWVTITNDGTAGAEITGVRIEEANRESAGDFILGADHCSTATLNPGESCEVLVRFSPGRENAASSAHLIIASTAPAGPLSIALSGTSTGLPQGPKGDTGAQGAKGDTGSQGARGDAGAPGSKGDTGPAGPRGSAGPQGPAGKNGKDGKDGVVSFTTAGGAGAQARRGGIAHLQFVLRNGTVGSLRGAKLSAPSLGGKDTTVLHVGTIKAGDSRNLSVDLQVGKHVDLGSHKVKVELAVGGHTLTQTVTVRVVH